MTQTNTPLKFKKCQQCGTHFENVDARKIYCSSSCKQDAYRSRHGIKAPSFLIGKAKEKPKTIEKSEKVSVQTINPKWKDLDWEIGRLNGKVYVLNERKKNLTKEEAELAIKIDDDSMDTIKATLNGFGIALLVGFIGFAISNKVKDKKLSDKIKVVTLVVSMSFAVFVGMFGGNFIASARTKRILNRIAKIKAEIETIDIEISEKNVEISIKSVLLASIPRTITEIKERAYLEQENNNVITVGQLQRKTFNTMKLDTEFIDLFGNPQIGFKMAIHGKPGNGKSTYAVKLAFEMSKHGKTLYVAAEEKFGLSLQSKIKNSKSDKLFLSNAQNIASLKRDIKSDDFKTVVVDSVQQLELKPEQLQNLVSDDCNLIYILQATKDGSFKGDNRYAHDADIHLEVKEYQPVKIKSRFI